MRAVEFRIWQASAMLSGKQVAGRLGCAENTVTIYRNAGVPPRDDMKIRLALAAISAGLKPWAAPKAAPDGQK